MIPSERRGEAPKGGVFENTDFEKNREYFHILPHDEPHALRRKAILEKYGPQIRALMTKDYRSAIIASLCCVANLTIAYYVKDLSWFYYFAIMWVIGAVINHTV